MFPEQMHDAYKSEVNLTEPSVCKLCGATYHQGSWHWHIGPKNAHQTICSACQRIHDDYPAGFLVLKGDFFRAHQVEIIHLLRNIELHERVEHPLKRIMEIHQRNGAAVVTTTDIHLANGLGDALHNAYQGKLVRRYNPEQDLLRVIWQK